MPQQADSPWIAAFPAIFVVLWATGFIGGKLGTPHAEPATFLTLRFGIVVVILTLIAVAMRAPWPKREALLPLAVGGVLIHAGYLGFLFYGMKSGVEAGASAMIAGLQPLLTAAVAGPFLGEKVTVRQWGGLLLGFAGVALVAESKLAQGLGTPLGMVFAFIGMVCLTAGTLWQKRHGGQMDLRTGSAVQFAAATAACAPVAIFHEGFRHEWTGEFIVAMAWLVLVLSVGTIFVLFTLIRRGAASKVASLFFLVPPTTALIAWFVFGEKLGPTAFAGMVLIVIAVAMVTMAPKREEG
ncbi:MAG: DMT family transporter [Beijerinckiaceae bacterium]